MAVIQPTPAHALDEAARAALRKVNTTAVVDVLARNGYDARYTYMPNLKSMNPGHRLVGRAVTVRFVPARPDAEPLRDRTVCEFPRDLGCGSQLAVDSQLPCVACRLRAEPEVMVTGSIDSGEKRRGICGHAGSLTGSLTRV